MVVTRQIKFTISTQRFFLKPLNAVVQARLRALSQALGQTRKY
jgi:hypothetical protein